MDINDSPFVFIGNNIAVDFINTEIVSRGKLIDLFRSSTDLVRWAHGVNLNLDREISAIDLTSVKDFRMALKDLYAAKIDNLPPSQKALTKINQHLANYSKPLVLLSNKNEYVLQPIQDTLTISMLLGYMAFEGAALLASSQARRLKRCNNPDCVLIFLDTSRNQKRRWCSMETCGNRAKVSTHYRKNQS